MEVLDSSGKKLPGSLWVADNMRGELEELDRAVAGQVLYGFSARVQELTYTL